MFAYTSNKKQLTKTYVRVIIKIQKGTAIKQTLQTFCLRYGYKKATLPLVGAVAFFML